jgi:hypothetical protein
MDETYTEDDLLQPILNIDMEWIENSVRKWCAEQRTIILKTGSRAHNCFYKRASVSAWRLTCMLYHLWCIDDIPNPSTLIPIKKHCIKFYHFMAQYILDGLLTQWGRQYDEMHKHDDDVNKGGVTPLYDQIPTQFSRDQLQELCAKLGLSPARIFLHKWKKAKLIHQPDIHQEIYIKNYIKN